MSTDCQNITKDSILKRLLATRGLPGQLIVESRKISSEHHLEWENVKRTDSRYTKERRCLARNINGEMKTDSPLWCEITAFIACICARGVLLVQSSRKTRDAENHYFFGLPEDTRFAVWLQRALATTVKYECGFKFNTDDQISSAAFERGAIMGVLKQALTEDVFETNEVAGVDYIMRTKEAYATRKLKDSRFVRLRNNMTVSVIEGVKEFATHLGIQAGLGM